jgi:hypothetical protein
VSDRPPPHMPTPPSPARRTPLLIALGTVAAAALIIGAIAVGSAGGDDDSAPAGSSSVIAGVGGSKALDFSPDVAADGLRGALPAIVAELQVASGRRPAV